MQRRYRLSPCELERSRSRQSAVRAPPAVVQNTAEWKQKSVFRGFCLFHKFTKTPKQRQSVDVDLLTLDLAV